VRSVAKDAEKAVSWCDLFAVLNRPQGVLAVAATVIGFGL